MFMKGFPCTSILAICHNTQGVLFDKEIELAGNHIALEINSGKACGLQPLI